MMVEETRCRYKLAPGAQVREESFGLLFYVKAGPRLYFLSSGELLSSEFFAGDLTLEAWLRGRCGESGYPPSVERWLDLEGNLMHLRDKGVIIEC